MKTAEFAAIGKALLPLFGAAEVKGKLLFLTPVESVLRGLHFERSSDRFSFYLWYFFLPLYVPTDLIYFNYGNRLHGGRGIWNGEDPELLTKLASAIEREAIPFFESVATLSGVVRFLRNGVPDYPQRVNPHRLEALGYSLIKQGDTSEAVSVLSRFQQIMTPPETPAERMHLDRVNQLQQKLAVDVAAAMDQLGHWETETKARLSLK